MSVLHFPKSANRFELVYNDETHTYEIDGRKLPSVTEIIGQFRRVWLGELPYLVDVFNGTIFPAEVFDGPGEVGTAIHKGCGLLLQGKRLNWGSMAEELEAPLRQFEAWLSEVSPNPVLIEQPMASVTWGFAGTADMVVDLFGGKGMRYLIDIKTGASGAVGPQTAAYEKAYREMFGWTGKLKRAVLELPKDGSKYKLKEQRGKDDWAFFKNRLEQWEYLNRKVGLRHG